MRCIAGHRKKQIRWQKNSVYTLQLSIEECVGYKPDFAVVAVNKTSICDVSIEWMDRGITVLSETPAALDMDSLKKLYRYHMSDDKNR